MATQCFLSGSLSSGISGVHRGTNSAPLAGGTSAWTCYGVRTSRGDGAQSLSVNTVAGPTSGLEVQSGSTSAEWISEPIDADTTISGTITFNLWASENSMNANAAVNCIIERLDKELNVVSTIVQTTRTTEVNLTTATANNFTATPTSTNMLKGDRFRIRIFFDDAGTMGSGFVATFRVGGTTAAADGDSYVSFNETFGFLSTAPTGSQLFLTTTAGPAVGSDDEREMWTSRGAGATTAVRNTAAGWTTPLQWTATAGGTAIEWYSRPLSAFTLTGLVRLNMRLHESSASAEASARAEIAIVNNDGSSPTIWAAGDLIDRAAAVNSGVGAGTGSSGELTTAQADVRAWLSGADTAVTAGQRLRLRLYVDDTSASALAASFTATLTYAGTSGGATGDSYITLAQTVTEAQFIVGNSISFAATVNNPQVRYQVAIGSNSFAATVNNPTVIPNQLVALNSLDASANFWVAGSSVVKTFSFAADADGMAEIGNSATVSFAHQADDGDPAGSVKFTTTTAGAGQTEAANRSSTGQTWETWGVPPNSIVTSVQITAWKERLASNTGLTGHSVVASLLDSGAGGIHAGFLLSTALGTSVDGSWQAGSAGLSRAVDSDSQASTTDVRLRLTYSANATGTTSIDQRFDEIELTINYSIPTLSVVYVVQPSALDASATLNNPTVSQAAPAVALNSINAAATVNGPQVVQVVALGYTGSVLKTFSFLADAEGILDTGNSNGSDVAFAWEAGDGDPAGCVKFTGTTFNEDLEGIQDALADVGETWEDWGVPAGALVTHIQLTGWKERTVAATDLVDNTLQIGAVTDQSTGSSPHHIAGTFPAGAFVSNWLFNGDVDTSVDGSWQTGATSGLYTVRPTHQASTTGVRLQLAMFANATDTSVSYDQRLDQIQLTIYYSVLAPLDAAATVNGPAVIYVVQPGAIDAAATVNNPAVTPGAVTVALNAVDAAATVNAPAVVQVVALNAIDAAATVNGPAPAHVIILPTAIDASATLNNHTITQSATVATNAIDASATVNAPTVVQIVALGGLNAAATVNNPTVTPGAVTVAMQAIDAAATVNGPQASHEIELNSIDASATVNAPTVVQVVTVGALTATATVNNPSIATGAVTIATNAIDAAAVVNNPSIATGAVTIATNAIDAAATVNAPTVVQVVTLNALDASATVNGPQVIQIVALQAIDASAVVNNPSVVTGEAAIFLQAIDASATVNGPQVRYEVELNALDASATVNSPTMVQVVQLSAIDATAVVNQPSIATGAVTVAPNAIDASATVNNPTVTPGAVTVALNSIDAAAACNGPQLIYRVDLASLNAAATVNNPTVTPGAVTVAMQAIDAAATVNQPAIATGAVAVGGNSIDAAAVVNAPAVVYVIALNAIDASATINAPTVVQIVALGGLNAAATVNNPTVTPGAVTVALNAINAAATLNNPTVTPAGAGITMAPADFAATVNEPTVTPGTATVAANAIDAAATVNQPTVTPGAVTVAVHAIDASATVNNPTVTTAAAGVNLNVLNAAATVNGPQLTYIVPGPTLSAEANVNGPALIYRVGLQSIDAAATLLTSSVITQSFIGTVVLSAAATLNLHSIVTGGEDGRIKSATGQPLPTKIWIGGVPVEKTVKRFANGQWTPV